MTSKKTYVLDTNVLLSDSNSIFAFQENDVIIPIVALEELDVHKNRQDEVGANARHVSRTLDGLRAKGNLCRGVELPSGGILKISSHDSTGSDLPVELRGDKVDNIIISFMLHLRKNKISAVLISKDINVRIKCDSLEVLSEDYLKLRATSNSKQIYSGVEVLEVDADTIDTFFKCGSVTLPEEIAVTTTLYPNQIVVLKNTTNGQKKPSAITRCVDSSGKLVGVSKIQHAFGLEPRNKEQNFAFELLFNPEIKLVTLAGSAGTGKTILSLAAALEQLKSVGSAQKKYDKLIIMRPVQSVGKEIGFLPGTLSEKMEPWISPIKDNLGFLVGGKKRPRQTKRMKNIDGKPMTDEGEYLSLLQESGLIEIEAITFIRGRSIPNAFIIVDEAQNLSMHELKTIITRAGEGTKIVLTGDIFQIDNSHIDIYTNGLTYAIEKFKNYAISGHVTLIKGERSELASLAAEIL